MTPAEAIALLMEKADTHTARAVDRAREGLNLDALQERVAASTTLQCAKLIQVAYNASLAQGVPQPVQFRNLDEEGKCHGTS